MGNEDPAPEALRSHASVQIKMRIQENAKKSRTRIETSTKIYQFIQAHAQN
jgi:hypothetical protein